MKKILLTRSKKRKNEENIYYSESLSKKQQQLSSSESIVNMNNLMENPGFSHITEKILLFLDHKSLQTGRLVCHSWKSHLDQPQLWIKKCKQRCQAKDLHEALFTLFQRIESGSVLEKELGKCLMTWHGVSQEYSPDELLGITPMHIAARCGFLSIVKYNSLFLEENKINEPKTNGITPIHNAARHGHLDIVKYFGEKAQNINTLSSLGWTPIQQAANAGHFEIFIYLASKLDNPNEANLQGTTAIHRAARNGHIEIVKYLMTVIENPNPARDNGITPIHVAAMKGHTEIINIIGCKSNNPNAADQLGWTPIHLAAYYGQVEVFKSPIFSSNLQNYIQPLPGGRTPIKLATQKNHLEVVKTILKILLDNFDTSSGMVLNALNLK